MSRGSSKVWYAYSIVPTGERILPDPGVLPEARIEPIPFGPLTVLASLVPRALFDRDNAANRTADPEWMAARIEAHHAVNVATTAEGPCLPLAFGALFSTIDLLGAWVAPRAKALQAALAQVAEQAEWALSLQEDMTAHTAWLDQHDPTLNRLAAAVAGASEGAAFLMVRRLQKARVPVRLTHITTTAASIAQQLADAGFGLLDEPRQSGLPFWTVLVPVRAPGAPHQADDALLRTVQTLEAGLAPAGLSLRLSGPWPAYAFARAALAEVSTHG